MWANHFYTLFFARWACWYFTKCYDLKLGSGCNLGKDLRRYKGLNQLVKHKNTEMYLHYIYQIYFAPSLDLKRSSYYISYVKVQTLSINIFYDRLAPILNLTSNLSSIIELLSSKLYEYSVFHSRVILLSKLNIL